MVNKGDIILIDFEPKKGHEQGYERPALVISNDKFNMLTQMTLVAPISHAKDFPYHIDLPNDANLKTDGKVLCEHVRIMDVNARGYRLLEHVPDSFMSHISNVIRTIL